MAPDREWHASDRGVGWEVHRGPKPAECWGRTVTPPCESITDGFRDTMTEEDARLAAVAPEAIAALRDLLSYAEQLELLAYDDAPKFETHAVVKAARVVIAKAASSPLARDGDKP
jgi:hypothetical protein